mgnify:CR=1 FL=1
MTWNCFTSALEIMKNPTVQGVVIGSFFSLGGVVLNGWASDRRQREQLKHDSAQATRERELSLKKDVYLEAAEAVSAGINAIAKFGNLDIPNGEVTKEFADKSSAIAKVSVIARAETVSALSILADAIGAAQMRLMTKRLPLLSQKAHIQILQGSINRSANERARFVELMKQHNLDGASDTRRWDVMQKNYEFEHKRTNEWIEEQNICAAALHSANISYLEECLGETATLRRLVIPTLMAVRHELELPLDEGSYRASVDASIKKQESGVGEFLQQMKSREGIPPQIGG